MLSSSPSTDQAAWTFGGPHSIWNRSSDDSSGFQLQAAEARLETFRMAQTLLEKERELVELRRQLN